MKNKHSPLLTLVVLGLVTSLVLVSTMFLKLPTPTGYIHLGDGVIYSVSLAFGGIPGAITAALGSGLADILGGYVFWAPWTFVIKGVAGLIAGKLGFGKSKGRQTIAMVFASAWIITGYALGTAIIYSPEALPVEILGNVVQTGSGIMIGIFLTPVLKTIAAHLSSITGNM